MAKLCRSTFGRKFSFHFDVPETSPRGLRDTIDDDVRTLIDVKRRWETIKYREINTERLFETFRKIERY